MDETSGQMRAVFPEIDLPPEFCHYEDTGCQAAPSCLNCPFPKCRYEVRERPQRQRIARDAALVKTCREFRKGVYEAAAEYGVSMRTVKRALRGGRHEHTEIREGKDSGGRSGGGPGRARGLPRKQGGRR